MEEPLLVVFWALDYEKSVKRYSSVGKKPVGKK